MKRARAKPFVPGVFDLFALPDRREFATDADRQRAIEAHRRRIQREIRKRRR